MFEFGKTSEIHAVTIIFLGFNAKTVIHDLDILDDLGVWLGMTIFQNGHLRNK